MPPPILFKKMTHPPAEALQSSEDKPPQQDSKMALPVSEAGSISSLSLLASRCVGSISVCSLDLPALMFGAPVPATPCSSTAAVGAMPANVAWTASSAGEDLTRGQTADSRESDASAGSQATASPILSQETPGSCPKRRRCGDDKLQPAERRLCCSDNAPQRQLLHGGARPRESACVARKASCGSSTHGELPQEKSRSRRSTIQLVSYYLSQLGREQRLSMISKRFSQEQRLALETFKVQERQIKPTVLAPPRDGESRAAAVKKEATAPARRFRAAAAGSTDVPGTKLATRAVGSACSRSRSGVSQQPRGIGTQKKGGALFYYANLGMDSLVLRCNARPSREEALEHLADLMTIKQDIQRHIVQDHSFENAVRTAVKATLLDRCMRGVGALGLTMHIRVSTAAWLGRDLQTPAYREDELDMALEAWRALRLARGPVHVGGCGLLSHVRCPAEAANTWARVRHRYVQLCCERGVPPQKMTARLAALQEAWVPHQRRERAKWEARQKRRKQLQERQEARRDLLVHRQQARHKKAQARHASQQRRAALHAASAMTKIEQLLLRWRPHKQTTGMP
eukprot:TRINITY_DN72014_c0_g1_i3.p1 TRINITY_DN72014_c0_g1~~TRINITY_DN72014_c0_g1_i3.p1  ORF type:complete len:571 (-),score=89.16 TRINITY_DN72014_c0_g1_i3:135-1847(-)